MSGATVSFAVFWSLVGFGTLVLTIGRIASRAGRRQTVADRPFSS
jgi:hypothetical protein